MKNVFFTLVLLSGILMSCGENESELKAKEETKCRAEFTKMLYEDEGTKSVLGLAESPYMGLGMEDDLKRFYEYVNNETTSCADRKKALNDFKEKIRVAGVEKAKEITGVQ
jgi:hypothetical protein